MMQYENNAYFWQKVETLVHSNRFVLARKKGDTHPEYSNLIYPTSYGHLQETTSTSSTEGVCVYKGTKGSQITGIVIAADILKKDLDAKILIGCTEEEVDQVLRFLNQTDFQKTVLIRKGNDIPSWGITD
ncbi:MAG: Inorganic pyrophosphatase [Erysipelotrichaceae bacterium]|nr:Inorganic pyrophosphatase [Erysipelotrichaceae bacterium]